MSAATSRTRTLVIGSAWLLGLRIVLFVLDAIVSGSPLASNVLGALIVDMGVGRAGVAWQADGEISRAEAASRFFAGLGAGITLACVALLVAHLADWATIRIGKPEPMVFLAVLASLGGAMRDELLFRALPLHVGAEAGIAPRLMIVFAAAMGPASLALAHNVTPGALALSFGTGLLYASLCHHLRGAWAAIAAHAAFSFFVGPGARGSVLDVVWWVGEVAEGPLASGAPAWVTAVAAAALAFFAVPRLPRARALAASPAPDVSAA